MQETLTIFLVKETWGHKVRAGFCHVVKAIEFKVGAKVDGSYLLHLFTEGIYGGFRL